MSLPWEALVPPSGNNHSDGRGPYPGSVHFPQALDRPGAWDYQHAAVGQDPYQGVWMDSKLGTLDSISDHANTRVVDCTQQAVSSYKTLTDAIAQCRDGDRILVRPGIYFESVVIDKNVEIIGAGKPGQVVIQWDVAHENVLSLQAPTIRLAHIKIKHSGQNAQGTSYTANLRGAPSTVSRGAGSSVEVRTGEASIDDCEIYGGGFAGVYVGPKAYALIKNSTVHWSGNHGVAVIGQREPQSMTKASHLFQTLSLKGKGVTLIIDSTVRDNLGCGVHCTEGVRCRVEKSQVSSNGAGGASFSHSWAEVTTSTLDGNRVHGIFSDGSSILSVSLSTILNTYGHGVHMEGRQFPDVARREWEVYVSPYDKKLADPAVAGAYQPAGQVLKGEIHENVFSGNTGAAVAVTGPSDTVARDNHMKLSPGMGCLCTDGAHCEIGPGNTFEDHSGHGVRLETQCRPNIHHNIIRTGGSSGVSAHNAASGCCVRGNNITANAVAGVETEAAADMLVDGNTIAVNEVAGILCHSGSLGRFTANDVHHNVAAGVETKGEGSAPNMKGNNVHHHAVVGINVHSGAGGVFEANTIVSQSSVGVRVATGANPTFDGNTVDAAACCASGEATEGIVVEECGQGVYCGNKLLSHSVAAVIVRTRAHPQFGPHNHTANPAGVGLLVSNGGLGRYFDNAFDSCGGTEPSVSAKASCVVEGGGTDPEMKGNTVTSSCGDGLLIRDGCTGTYAENKIVLSFANGVLVQGEGTGPTLNANTVTETVTGAGMAFTLSALGRATGNVSSNNNFDGYSICGGARPVLVKNRGVSNGVNGVLVRKDGYGLLRGNEMEGNKEAGMRVESDGVQPVETSLDGKGQEVSVVICPTDETAPPQTNTLTLVKNACSGNASGVASHGGSGLWEKNDCFENLQHNVYIAGADAKPHLRANTVRDGKLFGMFVTGGAAPLCEGNRVSGNAEAGVLVEKGSTPHFEGNDIFDGLGVGMRFQLAGLGTAKANRVRSNKASGVEVLTAAAPTMTINTVSENDGAGIRVAEKGLGTFRQNTVELNCGPGCLIQTAANPVFTENNVWKGKSEGFMVSDGGLGQLTRNHINSHSKPGICVDTAGDPTVTENNVSKNHFGGIYVRAVGTKGTFVANRVFANFDYGVHCGRECAPSVCDNDVYGNKGPGVLITSAACGHFARNIVRENEDANFEIRDAGTAPLLEGNTVMESLLDGVLVHLSAAPTLKAGNKCSFNKGAGMRVSAAGHPRVCGANEFFSNVGAGVLVLQAGLGDFEENIIFSNGGAGVEVRDAGSDPKLRANTIKDGKSQGVFVHGCGLGRFEENDVFANVAAGVEVTTEGHPVFCNSNLIHDGCLSGVLVHDSGRGVYDNNEVYNNACAGFEVATGGAPTASGNLIRSGKSTGVFCREGGLGKFKANKITDNTEAGVKVETSADPRFEANHVFENRAEGSLVQCGGLGVFDGNRFTANTTYAMIVASAGSPACMNNTFESAGSGLLVKDGGLGKFTENTFTRHETSAVEVTSAGNPSLVANTVEHGAKVGIWCHSAGLGTYDRNSVTSQAVAGVRCQTAAEPRMNSNDVFENCVGIEISEAGRGKFFENKIHHNAVAGGLVCDAGSDPFMVKNEVHSNYALGCHFRDCCTGRFDGNTVHGNTLAGCQISANGHPTLDGNTIRDGRSYGVRVTAAGKGCLLSNTIVRNDLAGIKVDGVGSSPDVTKGSASHNLEQGIFITEGGSGVFCDMDVASNRGHGASVSSSNEETLFKANTFREGCMSGVHFYEGGTGIVESNDIKENTESGVRVCTSATPFLTANRIYRNGAGGGVWATDQGLGTAQDNDIYANVGAGISIESESDITVHDNRIHDGQSYGIHCSNSGLGMVRNNHVHGNQLAGVCVSTGGEPMVQNNSIVLGLHVGVEVRDGGKGTFRDNTVRANALSGVLVTSVCKETSFSGNMILEHSSVGVIVEAGGRAKLTENQIKFNSVAGVKVNTGGDALLDANTIGGPQVSPGSPVNGNTTAGPSTAGGKTAGTGTTGTAGPSTAGGNSPLQSISDDSTNTLGPTLNGHPESSSSASRQPIGVWFLENATGSVVNNSIIENGCVGVLIQSQANPNLQGNGILRNGGDGVCVSECGRGVLTENTISGNKVGCTVSSGGSPELEDNEISSSSLHGIHVTGPASTGKFLGNTVSASSDAGMLVTDGGQPYAKANVIKRSGKAGVRVAEKGLGLFVENEIVRSECGVGVEVLDAGSAPDFEGCKVSKNGGGGILVRTGAAGTYCTNTIFENFVFGVRVDTGADPVFLDSNEILDTVGSGIVVAAGGLGTFRENRIIGSGVLPGGAGEEPGIVFSETATGGGRGANVLVTGSGSKPLFENNSVLESLGCGCEMSAGAAGEFRSNAILHNRGAAGVYVTGVGTSPLLYGNDVDGGKQAGFCCADSASPVIEKNSVSKNGTVGMLLTTGANPSIIKNQITDNTSDGVHATTAATGVLEGNSITQHQVCGMRVSKGAAPHCVSNDIMDNHGIGIVVEDGGRGLFETNVIAKNWEKGIMVDSAAPLMLKNTVRDGQVGAEFKGVLAAAWGGDGVGGTGVFKENFVSTQKKTGIYITERGNPQVLDNHVSACGDGVAVDNHGRGLVQGNEVDKCSTSAVRIASDGDPAVLTNRILSNVTGVCATHGAAGTVSRNIIRHSSQSGVEIRGRVTTVVDNNRIHDGKGRGVWLRDGSGGEVRSNDVFGNERPGLECEGTGPAGAPGTTLVTANRICKNLSDGCVFRDSGGCDLVQNEVGNNGGDGVRLETGANPRCVHNRVYGSPHEHYGVAILTGSQGCFEQNEIFSNGSAEVRVADAGSSPCFTSNKIYDGERGVHCVDGSAGLFVGNEITGHQQAAVEIESEANPVLKGNQLHCPGRIRCVRVHNCGKGVLEDNVIDNGDSRADAVKPEGVKKVMPEDHYFGISTTMWAPTAAIEIASAGSPTVRNNHIHNGVGAGVLAHMNESVPEGESIYRDPAGGKGSVESNIIMDTKGGAGIDIRTHSDVTVTGNVVVGGEADGIRVHKHGKALVSGNVVVDNDHNGIVVSQWAQATVHSNQVSGQRMQGICVELGGTVTMGNAVGFRPLSRGNLSSGNAGSDVVLDSRKERVLRSPSGSGIRAVTHIKHLSQPVISPQLVPQIPTTACNRFNRWNYLAPAAVTPAAGAYKSRAPTGASTPISSPAQGNQ